MDSSTLVALGLVGLVLVLAGLVVGVVLFVKLVRLRRVLADPEMPVQGKIAFWSALVYSVVPIDLLPDPVLIDDIGAMAAAIVYLNRIASRLRRRRRTYPRPSPTPYAHPGPGHLGPSHPGVGHPGLGPVGPDHGHDRGVDEWRHR